MNLNKRTKIRGKFESLLLLLLNISQAELASYVSQCLSVYNLRSVVKFSDFALSIVIMLSLWPHWHKQRRWLTAAQTKLSTQHFYLFVRFVALGFGIVNSFNSALFIDRGQLLAFGNCSSCLWGHLFQEMLRAGSLRERRAGCKCSVSE